MVLGQFIFFHVDSCYVCRHDKPGMVTIGTLSMAGLLRIARKLAEYL